MTIDEFLGKLDGVQEVGTGWKASCPAHNDDDPSLSVNEGDSGLLVHCFGGCSIEQVVAKLGLTLADLFYEPITQDRARPSGEALSIGLSIPPGILGQTLFEYRDASGKPCFYVQRIELRNGEKEFRQWGPTANGMAWQARMEHAPRPRPLYRLPAILADRDAVIVIHEGEKAVEAAVRVGLAGIHTTTVGGANNPKQTDFTPLAGRDIINLSGQR